MKTVFIDLGDYIFSMEVKESREELIRRLGTREDCKFPLYNLEELENLIKAGNNKLNWYCLGRENERDGKFIDYCIHAYSKELVFGCTADCAFYNRINEKSLLKRVISYVRNIIK